MSRDRMIDELKAGAGSTELEADASDKHILIRGCDSVMAERASSFMPQLLGNCKLSTATDDVTFLGLLQETKYDVVGFAPGACRWDAAGKTIPGGNAETTGWTLERYRTEVRKYQGPDVPIVGTVDEKQMIPIFRKALGLSG